MRCPASCRTTWPWWSRCCPQTDHPGSRTLPSAAGKRFPAAEGSVRDTRGPLTAVKLLRHRCLARHGVSSRRGDGSAGEAESSPMRERTMSRHLAAGLVAVLALSTLAAGAIPAAAQPVRGETAELVVHYASEQDRQVPVRATSLEGRNGRLAEVDRDGFGARYTFTFRRTDPDAYLGFRTEAATFGEQTRYVQATDGSAEVWFVDGDPRGYPQPQELPAADVTRRGGVPYVAVEDLTGLLDLSYSYGTNGYEFDGAATGTLDIRTITRGRDYYEIAVDTD